MPKQEHRSKTDSGGGGTDDDYETVKNTERGCGHLKHGKAYVRSPPSGGSGHLPAFVRFDPPVPYLERAKFRGYEYFPGIQFELSVTGGVGLWGAATYTPDPEEPPELLSPEEVREMFPEKEVPGQAGITETDPAGEVHRHITRMAYTQPDGDHAGDVTAFSAHDLYMHIGASYYPTPEEFIEEVEEQGLSKAIPVSESQEPPVINPGRTRLFLVHPKGVDEDTPGVIGYVYLHRTIYTETKDGQFPAWAKKESAGRPDMDLVRVGDRIYEDGKRTTQLGDEWEEVEDSDYSPEVEETTEADAARRLLPERVVPSDTPGRDVEGVPVEDDPEHGELSDAGAQRYCSECERWIGTALWDDHNHSVEPGESNLDEDAIREQLEESEDELREFSENYEPVSGEEGAYQPVEDDEEAESDGVDSQDPDDEEPEETPTADAQDDEDDGPRTDLFEEVEVVEVPRPEECPEGCGPVETGAMATKAYGDVEVRVCRSCMWDNASAVNSALTELDLRRDHDYNTLRSRASDHGISLQNPSTDELVDALLRDMGVL